MPFRFVFFILAALFAAGIASVVYGCFMSKPPNYIPMGLFPLLVFCPAPIFLASHCSDDSLFSSQKSGPAVEFGFFMTGMLLTSIFALPMVFYHVEKLTAHATIFSIAGSILILVAGFTFQIVFNSSSSDE